MGSSHCIKPHQKIKTINPVANDWFNKLSPNAGMLALLYISNLMDNGLPEQVAVEIVYKTLLFVKANGGEKK